MGARTGLINTSGNRGAGPVRYHFGVRRTRVMAAAFLAVLTGCHVADRSGTCAPIQVRRGLLYILGKVSQTVLSQIRAGFFS